MKYQSQIYIKLKINECHFNVNHANNMLNSFNKDNSDIKFTFIMNDLVRVDIMYTEQHLLQSDLDDIISGAFASAVKYLIDPHYTNCDNNILYKNSFKINEPQIYSYDFELDCFVDSYSINIFNNIAKSNNMLNNNNLSHTMMRLGEISSHSIQYIGVELINHDTIRVLVLANKELSSTVLSECNRLIDLYVNMELVNALAKHDDMCYCDICYHSKRICYCVAPTIVKEIKGLIVYQVARNTNRSIMFNDESERDVIEDEMRRIYDNRFNDNIIMKYGVEINLERML